MLTAKKKIIAVIISKDRTTDEMNVVIKLKVSVYPKFEHLKKKKIFAFSDKSYCNLSLKKNSKKKV